MTHQYAFLVFIILAFPLVLLSCRPNDFKSKQKITIGSTTYVCLYVAPLSWNSTGHYLQLSVEAVADKLSKIRIPKAWTSLNYTADSLLKAVDNNAGIGITLGSMGVLSYQRVFREVIALSTNMPSSQPSISPSSQPTQNPTVQPSSSPTSSSTHSNNTMSMNTFFSMDGSQNIDSSSFDGKRLESNSSSLGITYPIIFAIIDVEDGTVKSVVWDNFCHWCDSKKCRTNTIDYNHEPVIGEGGNCYVYDNECIHKFGKNETVSALCELTIYIAWHGTDTTGANFVSSSSRFSRWSSDQILNYTSSLRSETQLLPYTVAGGKNISAVNTTQQIS